MKKILIVDDNIPNRKILKKNLSSEYILLEAGNGEEALQLLNSIDGEYPDIILLDLIMPVMSGYEFLAIVKEDPVLSLIPVVITTQKHDESSEMQALSSGAIEFINKPYNMDIIRKRIFKIISLREKTETIKIVETDSITGLLQDVFVEKEIHSTLIKNKNVSYDMISFEIENYKMIENSYSTNIAHEVQRIISQKILAELEPNEVLGKINDSCFIGLVSQKEDYEKRLQAFSNKKYTIHNVDVSLFVKIGVYRILDSTIPVNKLISYANDAVKEILGKYDKYISFYDKSLHGKKELEHFIETNIENAIANKELKIFFIPEFNMVTNSLVSFETQIQWIHPTFGEIDKDVFLKIFEGNGFISHINYYIFISICEKLAELKKHGVKTPPVSINMSRANLYNSNTIKILLENLKKYDLKNSDFKIKISESQIDIEDREIISAISALKNKGFSIELDGFGAGYSSLKMLTLLPFDCIKIDLNVMDGVDLVVTDGGILSFIKKVASLLDIKMVAKSVDSKVQLKNMKSLDIDFIQGLSLSGSVFMDHLETFLEVQNQKEFANMYQPSDALVSVFSDTYQDEIEKILCINSYEEGQKIISNGKQPFMLISVTDENVISKLLYYQGKIKSIVVDVVNTFDKRIEIVRTIRKNAGTRKIPLAIHLPANDDHDFAYIEQGVDDIFIGNISEKAYVYHLLKIQKYKKALLEEDGMAKLKNEAYRDFLTGLLNRRGLEYAVKTIKSEEDCSCFALLMIDVDNLKYCNDTFGHDSGDDLIISFAEFLKKRLRNTDIIVRLGGDEFVVVLRNVKSKEITLTVAESLCKSLAWKVELADIVPTASIGAVWVDGEFNLQELITNADKALYQAKKAGKAQARLYEGE